MNDTTKTIDQLISEERIDYDAARDLFDALTGAAYYGSAFRTVLAISPEARAAAAQLVKLLRAAKVPGLDK